MCAYYTCHAYTKDKVVVRTRGWALVMGSSVQKEKHMSMKMSKSHDPSVSLWYEVGFFMRAMYSFTQTCNDGTRGVVEVTRSSSFVVGWGGG